MGCKASQEVEIPQFTAKYLIPIKQRFRQSNSTKKPINSYSQYLNSMEKKNKQNLRKVGLINQYEKRENSQYYEQNTSKKENTQKNNISSKPKFVTINYVPKELNENVLYFNDKLIFLEQEESKEEPDREEILRIIKENKVSLAEFLASDRRQFLMRLREKELSGIQNKKQRIIDEFLNNEALHIEINPNFYKSKDSIFE